MSKSKVPPTIFEAKDVVVWRQNLPARYQSSLETFKAKHGLGPFTVILIVDVPENQVHDAEHPQFLRLANVGIRYTGFWFQKVQ